MAEVERNDFSSSDIETKCYAANEEFVIKQEALDINFSAGDVDESVPFLHGTDVKPTVGLFLNEDVDSHVFIENEDVGTEIVIKKEDYIGIAFKKEVEASDSSVHAPNVSNSPSRTAKRNKRLICKFCFEDVLNHHYARHLQRHHKNENCVKEMLKYPKNSRERRRFLSAMRNSCNLDFSLREHVIPKRRSSDKEINSNEYAVCVHCHGFYKRAYLARHVSRMCRSNAKREGGRPLSRSQTFTICRGDYGNRINEMLIKTTVFERMNPDEVSAVVKGDPLIALYGESLLKKRGRPPVLVSNKLRVCGRFLMEMRKLGNFSDLLSTMKPQFFSMAVQAVKSMSGYNSKKKRVHAASFSLHMRTTLRQLAQLAMKEILTKNSMLQVCDVDDAYADISRYIDLLISQWSAEFGYVVAHERPPKAPVKAKLLSMTADIERLRNFLYKKLREAYRILETEEPTPSAFSVLAETTLALIMMHNRRRVVNVQYMEVERYENEMKSPSIQLDEFNAILSESERIMTQRYERMLAIGKGNRQISILLPPNLQKYLTFLVDIRKRVTFVPPENTYVFAVPCSPKCMNACVVLRKYAKECNAVYPHLVTYCHLQNRAAIVTQILTLEQSELEQLTAFLNLSTEATTKFGFPLDIHQVAMLNELLQLTEQGNAAKFKNMSVGEIDIDDMKKYVEEAYIDSDFCNKPEIIDFLSSRRQANTGGNIPTENMKDDSTCVLSQKDHSEHLLNEETDIEEKRCADDKDSLPSIECTLSSEAKQLAHAEDVIMPKSERRIIFKRPWTEKEVEVMQQQFRSFIKKRKAPRKHDVEKVIQKYPKLFANRNWVTMKAYVYNCYRLRPFDVLPSDESATVLESEKISDDEHVTVPKKGGERRIVKQAWTEEEVEVMKQQFGDFIRRKVAPRKHDVDKVIQKYPKLFANRNWVTMKAFVYNCYHLRPDDFRPSTESTLSIESEKSVDEDVVVPDSNKRKIFKRAWTKTEVEVMKQQFCDFIKKKVAPRKHDVEKVIQKYPKLFAHRNWVTMKAYVYNCYRLQS